MADEKQRRAAASSRSRHPRSGIADADRRRPPESELLGLVVLAERLRPEARETVEFFLRKASS